MNPIIEFCISNLAKGGDYVYNQLENDPCVDVLEYGCLQNCGICSSGLYALVNGDIVEGDSPDDLLQKIYAHIEETWIF
ncbi:YuzB family protein [Staphylococcus xylosus]|uniref:YuzB family protein n=1 Tax=Staphylococcus xylosus TaxID=1288 RepID=UPI00298F2645|nr:YuzB family protein [Staphylococcus xylosus]MDW8555775.1 YuzB family protein [Staphylococcus xylosus]